MTSALHPPPSNVAVARIGPNAIVQTAAALRARHGDAIAEELLSNSTAWHLDALPTSMVDEREVTSFVRAVLTRYPGREGHEILGEAGRRTAHYLLRARIPQFVQFVLHLLPRGVALQTLMASITRHAWTFAGSASFRVARLTRSGGTFSLVGCPMCRDLSARVPQCDFYAATFEELLRTIVSPSASVRELECEAAGAAHCRFVISF